MKRRTLPLALIFALVSIAHGLVGAQLHAQTKFGVVGGVSGGGSGSVTSVGLTAPAEISVAGSPVTTSGTLALTWASALQGRVFAGPCGSNGTPTFRVLCAADIPTLDPSKITGTAVVDGDARLTNARTPTAHASTHASAGADAVTLAESQVTGLTAALAGKQATGDYLTALTGDVLALGPGESAATIQANSVALGTDTTGGYAASSTEGGSATTADALAANGTNCSAPNFARGVDTAGNCEGAAIVASDLPNTAVTPGSYTSTDLTVDAQGRITAASNGTAGIGGSTGAVDNAILRADGTGGSTVQGGSLITISDAGLVQFLGSTQINATGNVGIKTAPTSDALTVSGTASVVGALYARNGFTSGLGRVGNSKRMDTTAAGNTAATETVLRSLSPDNIGTTGGQAFLGDGDSVSYEYTGTIAGTAATDKRIRIRLGPNATSADTLLFDSGALAITSSASWVLRGRVWRTGTSAQKSAWTLVTSDAAVVTKVAYIATTVSLSANAFVSITGEGTNANDVVLEAMAQVWNPTP